MQKQEEIDKLEWKVFVALLEKTFEPAGCTAILQQQLDMLTCKECTVLEYVTEFHCLSSHVDNTENAKIYKFIKELPANEVVQRAPEKLEAAIESALLYKARKNSINYLMAQLPNTEELKLMIEDGSISMEIDMI